MNRPVTTTSPVQNPITVLQIFLVLSSCLVYLSTPSSPPLVPKQQRVSSHLPLSTLVLSPNQHRTSDFQYKPSSPLVPSSQLSSCHSPQLARRLVQSRLAPQSQAFHSRFLTADPLFLTVAVWFLTAKELL